MKKSQTLLGKWITAKENSELEFYTVDGVVKVFIEKGKVYFVNAVLSSDYGSTLVLIDYDSNKNIPFRLGIRSGGLQEHIDIFQRGFLLGRRWF